MLFVSVDVVVFFLNKNDQQKIKKDCTMRQKLKWLIN